MLSLTALAVLSIIGGPWGDGILNSPARTASSQFFLFGTVDSIVRYPQSREFVDTSIIEVAGKKDDDGRCSLKRTVRIPRNHSVAERIVEYNKYTCNYVIAFGIDLRMNTSQGATKVNNQKTFGLWPSEFEIGHSGPSVSTEPWTYNTTSLRNRRDITGTLGSLRFDSPTDGHWAAFNFAASWSYCSYLDGLVYLTGSGIGSIWGTDTTDIFNIYSGGCGGSGHAEAYASLINTTACWPRYHFPYTQFIATQAMDVYEDYAVGSYLIINSIYECEPFSIAYTGSY